MAPHGSYSVAAQAVDGRPPTRIGGRIQEILTAFALMALPMLILSGVLLGLVFHNRVVQNDFASPNLAFGSGQQDPGVIFVQLSATTLGAVASWASTIASLLTSFAVTLVSYPIAREILGASQKPDAARLPTPYQLSLILHILSSASLSALWNWLKYSFGRRDRGEAQCKPAKGVAGTLILGNILSVLVLAADTWLHFTTTTVTFSQVAPYIDSQHVGFGVHANCTDIPTTMNTLCNLNNPASGPVLLTNDPIKVLSNISDTMLVQTHTMDNTQYAYLSYWQPSQLASVDYTANTCALQSQCTPVTAECIVTEKISGVSAPYKCPFAFEGQVMTAVGAANSVAMAYFTDSSGSNNMTSTASLPNPYYYAAMVLVNMRNPRTTGQTSDPQVAVGMHGGATIVGLFFNATAYDVEYTTVNGSVTRFAAAPSNASTTNILQGAQALTDVGKANLVQAAAVAGLGQSAQDISDAFVLSYSQTALAAASGAFEPRPALEMQVRSEFLVARVPKAPLACLVVANLLLVALGIVLTVLALVAVRGEAGEVQARLSIPAIVASYFEGERVRRPVKEMQDLFEERHGEGGPRIGLSKNTEGGWTFISWGPR